MKDKITIELTEQELDYLKDLVMSALINKRGELKPKLVINRSVDLMVNLLEDEKNKATKDNNLGTLRRLNIISSILNVLWRP